MWQLYEKRSERLHRFTSGRMIAGHSSDKNEFQFNAAESRPHQRMLFFEQYDCHTFDINEAAADFPTGNIDALQLPYVFDHELNLYGYIAQLWLDVLLGAASV